MLDVLLKAAQPHTCEQTILAEVLALRSALLNVFFKLASAVPERPPPTNPRDQIEANLTKFLSRNA
jgi:hypothetical protein